MILQFAGIFCQITATRRSSKINHLHHQTAIFILLLVFGELVYVLASLILLTHKVGLKLDVVMVLHVHIRQIIQQVPVPLKQALDQAKNGDDFYFTHVDDLARVCVRSFSLKSVRVFRHDIFHLCLRFESDPELLLALNELAESKKFVELLEKGLHVHDIVDLLFIFRYAALL